MAQGTSWNHRARFTMSTPTIHLIESIHPAEPTPSLDELMAELQVDNSGGSMIGGRDLFANNALNSNNNHSNNKITKNYFGANNKSQRSEMIELFRSKSMDYRVPHDEAFSKRAPNTCQWFLDSLMFQRWVAGDVQKLECTGVPGAGKTVMSAVVIERLRSLQPKPLVLYAYNKYATEQFQTPELFTLNFISQVLEHDSEKEVSFFLKELYDEYKNRPSMLPRHDRALEVLKRAISASGTAFIVIDALDEFNMHNPSAATELIRELEESGAPLLVTSRVPVPFSGDYSKSKIEASPGDIRLLVDLHLEKGGAGKVLSENQSLKEELACILVAHSAGMFLTPIFNLQSLMYMEKEDDIKHWLKHIEATPSSMLGGISQTYTSIVADIERHAPWVMKLVEYLLIARDITMGVRATLQYLAFVSHSASSKPPWGVDTKDLDEAVRIVLRESRGLVVIEDRFCQEDKDVESNYGHKVFQLCHLSVREILRTTFSQDHLQAITLTFVSTVLNFTPFVLNKAFHRNHEDADTPKDQSHYPDAKTLLATYPLSVFIEAWPTYAREIQKSLEYRSISLQISHRWFGWLLSQLKGRELSVPPDPDTYCNIAIPHNTAIPPHDLQTIFLARHGLLHYLTEHLERKDHPEPLDLGTIFISQLGDQVLERTALMLAASRGHLETCRFLLKHGSPITQTGSDRETALSLAAMNGHSKVVSFLLQEGSSSVVDQGNWQGRTPLWQASKHGHRDAVSLLIQAGAWIEARGVEGRTALARAANYGHIDIVRFLLSKGASVDPVDEAGDTPLIGAAEGGYTDVVTLLLEQGAYIDHINEAGSTALLYASRGGYEGTVDALLKQDASVDHADCDGRTPLIRATKRGHLSVVRALLEAGASPNLPPNSLELTPSFVAATEGHVPIVACLLDKGVDMHQVDQHGFRILDYAVMKRNRHLAKFLLKRGASPNLPNPTGFSLLCTALLSKQTRMVKSLSKRGALIEVVNQEGLADLITAARIGRHDILSLLLEHGAEVNRVGPNGFTPLIYASRSGSIECVRELVKAGAGVNAVDAGGRSPLSHAVESGSLETVEFLLQQNVNPQQVDFHGHTPIWYTKHIDLGELKASALSNGGDDKLEDPGQKLVANIKIALGGVEDEDDIQSRYDTVVGSSLEMTCSTPPAVIETATGSPYHLTLSRITTSSKTMLGDLSSTDVVKAPERHGEDEIAYAPPVAPPAPILMTHGSMRYIRLDAVLLSLSVLVAVCVTQGWYRS